MPETAHYLDWSDYCAMRLGRPYWLIASFGPPDQIETMLIMLPAHPIASPENN